MASAGRAVAGHTSLSIISQALPEWSTASASVPSVGPRTLARPSVRPSVRPQQRVLPMQLVFRLRRFHLRDERARRVAPTTEGRQQLSECAEM